MEYYKLESINKKWNKEVCLFGAGLIGQTWGYDIVTDAGFDIDFYCDNKIVSGTTINNVAVESVEELYAKKDNVLVFITVSAKYQKDIQNQLIENEITNIINMDYLFLQEFIESVLRSNDNDVISRYKAVVNDEEYVKKQFEYHCKYHLNLKEPKTFNEKIQWLKLYGYQEKYIELVDKVTVRNYVAEKIGEEFLVPLVGIWDSAKDIDVENINDGIVLKCTHDSGSTVIVKKKDHNDFNQIVDYLEKKRKQNFYWITREKPYREIKPRIIAEKYLCDNDELIDYKFLCANGKVYYIFTCSNRHSNTGLCVNFYDKEWNPLPFTRHYPKREIEIQRPSKLNEMIKLAERLSEQLTFVRVDFYFVNEKIYFSEMTLYPGNGMEEFSTKDWDYKLGEMINI